MNKKDTSNEILTFIAKKSGAISELISEQEKKMDDLIISSKIHPISLSVLNGVTTGLRLALEIIEGGKLR